MSFLDLSSALQWEPHPSSQLASLPPLSSSPRPPQALGPRGPWLCGLPGSMHQLDCGAQVENPRPQTRSTPSLACWGSCSPVPIVSAEARPLNETHLLQDLLEARVQGRLVQLVLVERQPVVSLFVSPLAKRAHPSISFFIDRSDLNGSKLRQNEISLHCRSSVASLNR